MVNFSLAILRQLERCPRSVKQGKTQWHNIAIFNDTLAEVAERYLKKGALVYLEGQNETRTWEKDGQRHHTTEVVLRPFNSALQMLDSREAGRSEPRERTRAARTADGPG